MKNKKKLWRADLDVNENLRRRLPKLASKYLKLGNRALGKQREWSEIHEFRLETKRFRYTLELFRSQYGPALERRIDDLKHIQKLLGDANDCVVSADLLKSSPGSEELRAQLEARAKSKAKKLSSWWRANLGLETTEDRWVEYLRRFAGRPPVPRRNTTNQIKP
jgi:CHAD domain-containing protein